MDVVLLAGGPAVLDVVGDDMAVPVGNRQFGEREAAVAAGGDRSRGGGGETFGDQPTILLRLSSEPYFTR
jgi:hypothetical protein